MSIKYYYTNVFKTLFSDCNNYDGKNYFSKIKKTYNEETFSTNSNKKN